MAKKAKMVEKAKGDNIFFRCEPEVEKELRQLASAFDRRLSWVVRAFIPPAEFLKSLTGLASDKEDVDDALPEDIEYSIQRLVFDGMRGRMLLDDWLPLAAEELKGLNQFQLCEKFSLWLAARAVSSGVQCKDVVDITEQKNGKYKIRAKDTITRAAKDIRFQAEAAREAGFSDEEIVRWMVSAALAIPEDKLKERMRETKKTKGGYWEHQERTLIEAGLDPELVKKEIKKMKAKQNKQ